MAFGFFISSTIPIAVADFGGTVFEAVAVPVGGVADFAADFFNSLFLFARKIAEASRAKIPPAAIACKMGFIETAPVGVGFDCRTVDSIVDASHVVAAYDIVASTWTVAAV